MIFSSEIQKKTLVNLDTTEFKLSGKMGFLGSCFAKELGDMFSAINYPAWVNPGGTLYNPASIEKLLQRLLKDEDFTADECQSHLNGKYFHWLFDTRFHSDSSQQLCDKLNSLKETILQQWNQTNNLVITLGSAWVYQEIDSNNIVANCHRLPQQRFSRRILSQDEINHSLKSIRMMSENKNLIWSLSPIRHWKDGAQGNSLSKALLRLGINSIVDSNYIESKTCNLYFPSYEMVLDEFRDYSHFTQDGVHLKQEIIAVIADRFIENYLCQQSIDALKMAHELFKLKSHNPLNEDSQNDLKNKIQFKQELFENILTKL